MNKTPIMCIQICVIILVLSKFLFTFSLLSILFREFIYDYALLWNCNYGDNL